MLHGEKWEVDNVGEQRIRSKRSWKDMAHGTAEVKTFGSGETLKTNGTGLRRLKEGLILEMQ